MNFRAHPVPTQLDPARPDPARLYPIGKILKILPTRPVPPQPDWNYLSFFSDLTSVLIFSTVFCFFKNMGSLVNITSIWICIWICIYICVCVY